MTQNPLEGDFLRKEKNPISKNEFFQRLKVWKQLTHSQTLGDLNNGIGTSVLLLVQENGNNLWKVHSDTKRDSVVRFLSQKENSWKKTRSPKGRIVLTNNLDGSHIEGFYVYLK
jgi:hypothetical protein